MSRRIRGVTFCWLCGYAVVHVINMATSKWSVTKTVVICCTSGITPPSYIANIRSQYKDPYERKPVFHVMVMSRFCLRCFSVQENQEEEASHGAKNKRKSEGKENSAGGDWELPSIFRTIRGWRDFFVLGFFFHEIVFCTIFEQDCEKKVPKKWFLLDLESHFDVPRRFECLKPGWWLNKYFWNFHPETWGNDPIWRIYFSNGLVQPAPSFPTTFCLKR